MKRKWDRIPIIPDKNLSKKERDRHYLFLLIILSVMLIGWIYLLVAR